MKGVRLTDKQQTRKPGLVDKWIGESNIVVSFLFLNDYDDSRYNAWHVGLLMFFQEMGCHSWDNFQAYEKSGAFRVAETIWDEKKMGCARREWPMLLDDYRENEREFPLWHLSIGYASGHVLGLLGPDGKTFYVLKVIPFSDHYVDNEAPLEGYNQMVVDIIEDGKNAFGCQYKEKCEATGVIKDIVMGFPYLYVKTDKDLAAQYDEMLKNGSL